MPPLFGNTKHEDSNEMKLTVAYVTYLLLFLIQKSVEQSLLAFRLVYLMDMNGIDDVGLACYWSCAVNNLGHLIIFAMTLIYNNKFHMYSYPYRNGIFNGYDIRQINLKLTSI